MLYETLFTALFTIFQLLPGAQHAELLPEDHEPEVRQLRVRPAAADAQHPLRKHQERDVNL